MSARLKYNPAGYKRLAEIAGWLANGKNVQCRRTGDHAKEFGAHWMSFTFECSNIQNMLGIGYKFRIKPNEEPKR